MLSASRLFNIYLCFPLLALFLAPSCRTPDETRARQLSSTLRLHLSARPGETALRESVQIAGVTIFIERSFFLDERSVEEAQVLDTPDGAFALRIAFNDHGRMALENITGTNPGRQIVVFTHFGTKNATRAAWLAAPRIPHRISDGVLVFTPLVPRDVVEEIVHGLNNVAAKQKQLLSW